MGHRLRRVGRASRSCGESALSIALAIAFGCGCGPSAAHPDARRADPLDGGDPCRSPAWNNGARSDAAIYRPLDQPGDQVWVQTPEITHTRDYFSYEDFVRPGFPSDWRAANFVDGQLWLRVEVLETAPGATFPIYYTVTWGPGVDGRIRGFLRAAVEINRPGPAVYEEVADVREIEYSPDGSCCQSVCDRPWPWENAWRSVAGDVVAQNAQGFPLRVRARIVLRPARP